MATETVSSDHPTALEQVEKEVHEEVKTMEEKNNEVKPKEDSPIPVVSSAESVEKIHTESESEIKKSDEEEKPKAEEPGQTVIKEIKKKADENEKPTTEEVKKTDDAETPKTEQQPAATTATEEVNKHVETPASDVTREEVVVLNKESAPAPEAESVPEEAGDVVKGESESVKVEIPEKELQDKQTTESVETDEDKKEQVEELRGNEPEKAVAKEAQVSEAEQNKETIIEPVANVEDKLAEQPEVTEKIEQEPAEIKTENIEAGKVEENDTKDVKTNQEDEKKSVVTEAKEVETSEKAPEVKIASRGAELMAENGNNKDENHVTTEINEATEVEKKVDEATATVTEKSVETKVEEETGGGVEPKLEQEAKADAAKDGEERKTLEEAFKEEVPAKAKQSNNLFSKMKQSLVKAKKAIIGKSPSSKSETKNEFTAK